MASEYETIPNFTFHIISPGMGGGKPPKMDTTPSNIILLGRMLGPGYLADLAVACLEHPPLISISTTPWIWGLHGHGDTPIAGWFVSWENPIKIDDLEDFGGTPISGNLHIVRVFFSIAKFQVFHLRIGLKFPSWGCSHGCMTYPNFSVS